jgi:uroporphyrinogen-III synthase
MKVLVTRLERDCEATAEKLVELGFDPVLLPLTRLKVFEPKTDIVKPDFTLFTSASAVTSIPKDFSANFENIPAYAVGPKTALALSNKAYKNIRKGAGDAKSLAKKILHEWSNKRFSGLYICGEERSFDFQAAFQNHGCIELCEVYRILELDLPKSDIGVKIEQLHGGISLVYSPSGARSLIKALDRAGKTEALKGMTILAISAKAAEPFEVMAVQEIIVAPQPTEEAMMEALKRHCA